MKPTPIEATGNNKEAMVQILPHLYLGPRSSTAPASALASGITHIISIGSKPQGGDTSISYHRIGLLDTPSASLRTPAHLASEIINAARAGRPDAKVLVHCVAGVSRSPAVIAAHLILEEDMSLRDALAKLVGARPAVRPNDGFLAQLKELEVQTRGGKTSIEVETLPLSLKERRELLSCSALP